MRNALQGAHKRHKNGTRQARYETMQDDTGHTKWQNCRTTQDNIKHNIKTKQEAKRERKKNTRRRVCDGLSVTSALPFSSLLLLLPCAFLYFLVLLQLPSFCLPTRVPLEPPECTLKHDWHRAAPRLSFTLIQPNSHLHSYHSSPPQQPFSAALYSSPSHAGPKRVQVSAMQARAKRVGGRAICCMLSHNILLFPVFMSRQ